ncbi:MULTISPECIES: stage III sporulation protein AB [Anaerotruncus]|uniref:stage III sporulation protein AB n=1 Tax=Anaerotruncus TaxID=244127 RepID=UPI00083190C0|nr:MULTISPECIES: stage III sporulation protein AB [Anaerotruncus]RGX56558.1 hypothetical protein DWV16_02785 [Anaerotruncus sp. AF02-27]
MYAFLKVSGMVLVVLCTTSIGMAMAKTLTNRVEELEACIAALAAFESELSYSLAPPDEVVGRLESRESLSAAAFLPACASLCRRGIPFPKAWKQAITVTRANLAPDDLSILTGLADTLGQCDLQSQLAQLAHAKALLQMQLTSAQGRCGSYAKLYRTMGVLAGAFVVIVFI